MLRRNSGFTLTELLIAALIGVIVLSVALSLISSSRAAMNKDSARVDLNQSLRTGLDLVGNDTRQSGERLQSSFPAVEVVKGAGSTPDTLYIRRNLIDVTLPVCQDIKAGSNTDAVFVAAQGSSGSKPPPPQCKPKSDPGIQANLAEWAAYRAAHGGKVVAYLYERTSSGPVGEFFIYDAEDSSNMHLHKAQGSWQNDYPVSNAPQLLILEERKYTLDPATKQLVMYENGGAAQPVTPNTTSFKVNAYLSDKTTTPPGATLVTGGFPSGAASWKDLAFIEVSLSGQTTFGGSTVTRTISNRFTPRNVLSADN